MKRLTIYILMKNGELISAHRSRALAENEVLKNGITDIDIIETNLKD